MSEKRHRPLLVVLNIYRKDPGSSALDDNAPSLEGSTAGALFADDTGANLILSITVGRLMKVHLKKLNEQVVVITGASSGIGLATARMAAQRGARLVLAARSADSLSEIVNELTSAGCEAVAVRADVGTAEDVQHIASVANERFDGFDTWVNNAGVSIYGRLLDVSISDQRRVFETNYWGTVHGSLIAARHLATRGGAIINVGSTLSDRAVPLQGTYCASKHAVKGFTDALRMELEHDSMPISVTLIKPGAIDTPYTEHAENYLPVEPKHPAPVYAPEVVADAILHCSENPVRDVFVGVSAKVLSIAGHYMPRLTDRMMEWRMFPAQEKSETPKNDRTALHRPSHDSREAGVYEGHVSKSSLYTTASLHPMLTGGLLLAGTGLAYAVARSFKNGH
ncbi:MAG: SDR family oxidoreductase [Pyrinomonadaceae bacterium]